MANIMRIATLDELSNLLGDEVDVACDALARQLLEVPDDESADPFQRASFLILRTLLVSTIRQHRDEIDPNSSRRQHA